MKQIALLFLFVLLVFQAKANIYSPTFKNINLENGLSNSTVRSITKDADGFMWFGTYDGLCRYDGINMKVFRKISNDSTSINHNHISYLFCDSKKQLYVGTRKGLNLYIPKDETFKPVQFHEFDTHILRNSTSEINIIVEDNKKNLFVGTLGNGLLKFNDTTNEFEQIKIIDNKYKLPIQTIAVAPNNELYLGIGNKGIAKYNTTNGKVVFINQAIKEFHSILYNNDILYIGTAKGLVTLNLKTNKISQFENIPQLKSIIHFLKLDINKVLWIGTETNGIVLIDTKNNAMQFISSGYQTSLLTSVGIYCLFKDDNNISWIGTMRGGVEMWDPKQNQLFSRRKTENTTPAANMITSFLEVSPSVLWIGTDGGGLQQFNIAKDKFEENSILNKINNIAGNAVISMVKDKFDNVWFATYGNGLICYNLKSRKISKISTQNSILKSNYIWSLYIDKESNLWIGGITNGGLFRYNYEKQHIELINLKIDNALTIKETKSQKIIIGIRKGLVVYDPAANTSFLIKTDVVVRSICEDKNKTIWIGTQGNGLMILDLKTKILKLVDNNLKYLKQSSIMSIIEDENKNLWISTTNGLYRFNYTTNSLTSYDKKDGLQSIQFNYSSALKTQDKKLFFGGINGFTFFDPKTIKKPVEKCPLHIIDFSIFNNSIFSNKLQNEKIIDQLSKKDIVLKHDDAFFRLDFTAISFDNPEKTQYMYKLEGLDKEWNYAGTNHNANFSGLEQGDYVFKVKYSTQPGHWSNEELEINIKVLPPFYQTWWAYMFYFLVILGIIYIVFLVQSRQNKLKQDLLMADLKEEQVKQVQQIREQFFINISHELRTPLTLIIPPMKDSLSSEPFVPLNRNELQSIFNNANRLLLLINKLLLFRKTEMGKNQLKVSQSDIVVFTNRVFENFSQIARKKNIQFIFQGPQNPIQFWFDNEKMEIILYNLLSNAFKYTPDGGKIELKIKKINDRLIINVLDSGCGIAKTDLNNIFTRFYSSNKFGGIGIGLSLVKTYVELMNGTLLIESELNKGTNFTVNFQMGAEYRAEEIDNENITTDVLSEDITEIVGLDTEIQIYQTIDESAETENSNLLKILIVDDNLEILSYINKILLSTGLYEVNQATDGKTALKMAKSFYPDIIISDVHMPIMNGLELCRAIKEDVETNHIYFILITADIFETTENNGLGLGADEFITKPFDKTKLLNKIKTVFNYQQRIRKYFENTFILGQKTTNTISVNTSFIDECVAIIKANYNSDSFSPLLFSEKMNMSQSALYKKIKLCTGKSINELIRTVKMSIAAELILEGKLSITQIGAEIGIYDSKYFRDCFKKQFGVSPSKYGKPEVDN
jgi:signal transduction histidine kinase/ligand-binding sensor domain-containing protein/CheY-like chemotaxis protein/AraC-like DNA-binding protein